MKLEYSTELEEIAYSKDADALFKAASHFIQPQDLTVGRRDASFFKAGVKFALGLGDVEWFTWHGDGETALFFHGRYNVLVEVIRSLPDRRPGTLCR